ncbi:Protein of unknown function, partial [Gryllus bimaculatus]
LGHVRSAR